MYWREDLLDELGYIICPLVLGNYVLCDENCDLCDYYRNFRKEIIKYERFNR